MKVIAAKADGYDLHTVERGINEIFSELGGLDQYIKSGDKVLLKPNLVEGVYPDKAVTTHPEVVRAVIRAVKQIGAIPVVGDSPGISSCFKAAEKCGIWKVCQQEEVELLPFDNYVDISFSSGRTLKKITVAKEITQVDKIISLAKMKTHTFMGITGAVKNLFGFIVGPQKAQFHLRMKNRSDFAGMLIDLNELIKPVLYIVDGIVGMEGNGPRNGIPKPAGILLAGTDGYAVDLVMAEFMGFKAEKMPVAAQALAWNLSVRLDEIKVVGTASSLRLKFIEPKTIESLDGRLPRRLIDFFQNQLTARPYITEKCAACGRCAHHCPPNAIVIEKNHVKIDYTRCIRCYCCQELCPHDAIQLRDGFILKLVRRIW